MERYRPTRVCVVVLGDIGRSPRMKYHSLCLANAGHDVDVVGYADTDPGASLASHPSIRIHPLVPYSGPNLPSFFGYVVKALWQAFVLLCALAFKRADAVLVQNPPAVPTLPICWLYCFCTRARLMIDWHNYAHTLMALKLPKKHILVRRTKSIESFFGKKAHVNFCVTNAMKNDLKTKWNVTAHTLYDKPSETFRTITLKEKHAFFNQLSKNIPEFADENDAAENVFTKINSDGEVVLRKDRPALLVSSTSWTQDEDFSILLHALEEYEESFENENVHNLPLLLCVITGKGPMKDFYLSLIKGKEMKNIKVVTPWLETDDYPKMLASADLGVCLHTSSSGLDLPMKVVDMFGCCLPVCAFDFKCLYELVKHDENSYVFKDSQELSQLLQKWFADYPGNKTQRETEAKFKEQIGKFQEIRWAENWQMFAAEKFP